MASTNATSSSSTSNSTSAVLPVNTSLLLLSNMSSMMTVKLNYGNYIVWKHQIEVILETYSMIDVIDDSIIAPDRFLKDSSSNFTTEISPNFISWKNREQAMFTFINSTLSPSILALTVGQKSAKGVWKVLEKRFASISRSHVMSLRNELNAIKKGSDSINNYFQKIKQTRDKLAVVSVFLDDEELLHIAFDGLSSEYDSFSSAIRTHSDVLSIEELNTLLNSEERVIKKRSKAFAVDPNLVAMAMNFQPQHQGFPRGRGGRNNNQRGRGGRGYNPNGGHNSSGYGNSGYNPNSGGYGNSGYNPNSGGYGNSSYNPHSGP
nr:uncharacterized protein LOC112015238 [Quercus suber]